MAMLVSSFRIRPPDEAVPSTAPGLGEDRVPAKRSFSSARGSALMATVMVLPVSPGAKVRAPPGSTPPVQSAALAGAVPLPVAPAAAHCTDWVAALSPLRVTVKI